MRMIFSLTGVFLRTTTGKRGSLSHKAVPWQGLVAKLQELRDVDMRSPVGVVPKHQLGVCSENGLGFSACHLYRGIVAQ